MAEHVILFLAANTYGSSPLKLSEECAEIQRELKLAPYRNDFRFESRWAAGTNELMRHLNELDPTVLHFSGHGGSAGVMLQDEQGRPKLVSPRSLAMMIEAAARRVRIIVLNACYSAQQAAALRAKVDCVMGMDGAIDAAAARAFAMRFYGALGNRRSIGNAVAQGVAAMAAREAREEALPRCLTRDGIDADQLVLPEIAGQPAASTQPATSTQSAASTQHSERIDVRIERDRHQGYREFLPVEVAPSPRSLMTKHTILFLAANPLGTDRLALDREACVIQVELERSGQRDQFELVTRWAAEPLDLLRELRKLRPTVVHFSGHGGTDEPGQPRPDKATRRDVVDGSGAADHEHRHGLFLQGPDGRPQLVSTAALEQMFGAAGSSVRLVVLSACYSEAQAEALLAHVDCIVGMNGSITDNAAQSFAIGFYGGLGERESVTQAFKQGRAAISFETLRDSDRPQLKVRHGIDADQLVLADNAPAGMTAARVAPNRPTGAAARPPPHAAASSGRPDVDIGILTIRDDEFRAVLGVFSDKAGVYKGTRREYALRHAELCGGEGYVLAILRQIEQGNGEAQSAARDLIDDLAPRLVLVVGIAGGLPSDDVTLGDVVLSTRIHDFTVGAQRFGEETTYATTGGPIDRALAAAVANMAAREDEMGDWTAELPSPPAATSQKGKFYGPAEWQRELREKLAHHHGERAAQRAPRYMAGPIASSDRLVKDPALLFPWITTARGLLAVEMESAGVYRAARERCPMLAIRGISDIVGLKRTDAWTKFACASAAAFTRAFLRTRPVPVGASVAANPP